MKSHFDKILLGLAAIVFAASLLWSLRSVPRAQRREPAHLLVASSGYEPIAPPAFESRDATWEAPRAQGADGLWLYDVFTPPKIYIDPQTRLFSVVPYEAPEVKPFGVRLAGMKRELYRFQYEGFIEEEPADFTKSLIRIHDRKEDDAFLARVGQAFLSKGIRIEDFRSDRAINDGGLIETREVLVLSDLEAGQTVALDSGGLRYSDKIRVDLEAEGGTGAHETFSLSEPGGSFEWNDAVYRLLEIDPEGRSVRIEKIDTESGDREVKVLRPGGPDAGRSMQPRSSP